jgi:hypothetical protein
MIWLALILVSVGAGWLFGHGEATLRVDAAAPEHLLLALFGVTLGLVGRDRIRLRRTYASPSLAYAGKFALAVSAAGAATWMFAPVDWPAWWLQGFAAGGAGGAALYLGNLPLRL